MSRIGKNPVTITDGVNVTVSPENVITVKGPKGELKQAIDRDIKVEVKDGQVTFVRPTDQIRHRALHGLYRSLVSNMVKGVTEGYKKQLELVGVGYKAAAQGAVLNLELGYSHPINHKMPAGVTVQTPTPTEVILTGVDKQVIGQIAAQIRAYRAPEPYKGKGVRYADEVVAIKETKKK